ncbi:MAG: hypothetical protein A2X32_04905 [Elusimicrobia bacterium GWC2_64_44]|nr:MAG: hypothetical protein A2X32_04905 [Elusimicrobia bacterium GWC2_64_44]
MRKYFTFFLGAAALAAAVSWLLWLRGGMDAAEGVRKLSGMRVALELYRQQHKKLPTSFAETLRAGTLEMAPQLKLRGHLGCSSVADYPSMRIKDTGGWAYVNDPADPAFGLVFIDCAHKDERGRFWSEF